MVSIGVDIGTTTICACVLDTNTGEVSKPGRKNTVSLQHPAPKQRFKASTKSKA